MKKEELIEQCRYYKGGENPFNGTGKEMEGSYLEVSSHHYPEYQIPSGDKFIK